MPACWSGTCKLPKGINTGKYFGIIIVFSKVAPLYSCLVSYQVLYYYTVVISLGLASHSIGNLEFIKFINAKCRERQGPLP